jgi:hypothetical protein
LCDTPVTKTNKNNEQTIELLKNKISAITVRKDILTNAILIGKMSRENALLFGFYRIIFLFRSTFLIFILFDVGIPIPEKSSHFEGNKDTNNKIDDEKNVQIRSKLDNIIKHHHQSPKKLENEVNGKKDTVVLELDFDDRFPAKQSTDPFKYKKQLHSLFAEKQQTNTSSTTRPRTAVPTTSSSRRENNKSHKFDFY